ncbi:hypothetical protein [uncultured Bifidobacterium sp.]|uniref:hypothetical protein n=1 Tax=uncultured Bifidobacterium sp. TaxID=165187 RepID=UPI0026370211|nr:hypothetical protein [uncultured Bifidobacterium sp.]
MGTSMPNIPMPSRLGVFFWGIASHDLIFMDEFQIVRSDPCFGGMGQAQNSAYPEEKLAVLVQSIRTI